MGDWAVVEGRLVPLDQASWPATDPAVTVGMSIFETLRSSVGGEVHKIDEHLDRLERSGAQTGIDVPSRAQLADELRLVAREVGVPARVRVTVSGSGRHVITAQTLDQSRMHRPVRAVRGLWRDEPYLGGSVKHGSRAPWVVATRRSGAEDVLLVDEQGRFTEGTTSAILAVIDGELWTAPHDGRILESNTCLDVLDRARALGVPIRREGPPSAGPWDGLYVASTTRDLAPVIELDGEGLSGWDPVGRALADAATS